MDEQFNKLILEATPSQESANALIGRLFDAAQPSAVFSEPVVHGEYAVITASEVSVAMGAGYGGGGGAPPSGPAGDSGDASKASEAFGAGGGGGGGGTAMSRPVAVISIGPAGVHVEPIVDPTKLGLALFTAIGGMVLAMARMRKFAQQRK
jgi:uncharacterized spore protein YtfJ